MDRPPSRVGFEPSQLSWWRELPVRAWRRLAWWAKRRWESARVHADRKRRQWCAVKGRVLLYLVVSVLTLAWNYGGRLKSVIADHRQPCTPASTAPSEQKWPWIYRYLAHWHHSRTSEPVIEVFIPKNLTQIQLNTCNAREYLSRLLTAIESQQPTIVVVDKYFGQRTCLIDVEGEAGHPAVSEKQQDLATQHLISTVQAFSIPIVVGQHAENAETDQEKSQACLITNTADNLDFGRAPNLSYGLLFLNADVTKIPLQWSVADKKEIGAAQEQPGLSPNDKQDALAFAAYRTYGGQALAGRRMQSLLEAGRNPYIDVQVPTGVTSSEDVLCWFGARVTGDPASCTGPAPHLAGRAVLVGAQGGGDTVDLMGTTYWGYEMQARYLSALITGSYLLAPPFAAIAVTYGVFGIAYLYLFRPTLRVQPGCTVLGSYWRAWRKPLGVMISMVLLSALVFRGLNWLPPLAVYVSYLPVLVLQVLIQTQTAEKQKITHTRIEP